MKRRFQLLLTFACIVVIACAATACSSTSDEPQTETQAEATEEEQSAESMSDEDLAAALEAEYGSADWYPRVQWIGTDQVLLARVIRVETDLESGDFQTAGDIGNAVGDIMQSEDAVNIQVISANGSTASGQAWGSEMGDVMDLPPAPTTAEELQSWIDTVYGESGEDWYAHIESYAVSDNESGWPGTTVIVIQTDLPDRSDEAHVLAAQAGQAVTSTGQTIAQSYIVKMSSGEQLLSGDLPSFSLRY